MGSFELRVHRFELQVEKIRASR